MSKRGQKLNLAEFHSTIGGSLNPVLPTAPSGHSRQESDRSGRWDKQRAEQERTRNDKDKNDRNDRDRYSEKGDRSDRSDRSQDRHNDRHSEEPSRADEGPWRRSTPVKRDESRADEAAAWRRSTEMPDKGDSDWRKHPRPERETRNDRPYRRFDEKDRSRDSFARFGRNESGRFNFERQSDRDTRPEHLKRLVRRDTTQEKEKENDQPSDRLALRFARPASPRAQSPPPARETRKVAGDTRPEHLKRIFTKTTNENVIEIKMENKVEPKVELSEERYDSTLFEKAVAKSAAAKKRTALKRAIADRSTINDQQLIESFKLINLSSDEEPISEVADVLSKSLIEKKLTFGALLKQLHNLSNLSKDQSRELLLNILSSIQNKRSDRELKVMITTEQHKSILSLISNEESQQKEILKQHNLIILIPVIDLSASVKSMCDLSKSPDEILSHINSTVGSDAKVSNLSSTIIQHMMTLIYSNKSKPSVDVISSFATLLKRVLNDDSHCQIQSTVEVVNYWFKNGAIKGTIKQLLQKLYSENIISAENLIKWRDDNSMTKSAGKQKALLQLHSWLIEVTPKKVENEDEEESEADSIDDEQ